MPDRRFPPPWTIEEHHDACFIVRDSTGQALGYFYFGGVRSALNGCPLLGNCGHTVRFEREGTAATDPSATFGCALRQWF